MVLYICIRNPFLFLISFSLWLLTVRNVDAKPSTCAYIYALETDFSKLPKIVNTFAKPLEGCFQCFCQTIKDANSIW
jgi:hypothetical protein